MSTREQASVALLSTLTAAYAWNNTPSRRLKMWKDVPSAQQPALFQFEGGVDPPYVWTGQPNPKRTINVKLFVYFVSSDANPGATTLNAIAQAIDGALAAPAGNLKQTLGGVVDNARIKSVLLRDPGDVDPIGQGLLVLEVEMILP